MIEVLLPVGSPTTIVLGLFAPLPAPLVGYVASVGALAIVMSTRTGSVRRPGEQHSRSPHRAASIFIDVATAIELTYEYAWLIFSTIVLLRNAWPASQLKEPIRAASSSIIPALSARLSKAVLPASPIRRSSDLSNSAS
jgi:hypothetical protein